MNPTEPRESLIDKTVKGFCDYFGNQATHVVSAPGRLNVIGEHVDYNGGVVLPAAIERWIFGVFKANDSETVRIWDIKYEDSAELNPNGELKAEKGSWLNYPKGVFAQFQKAGVRIPGFDLCLYSNVPTGGGLSSSAAFESLIATIVEELTGKKMDLMEKALLCQKAEHEYAGVPCGIMDQAAVIMGKSQTLLQLDCRDLSVKEVPFQNDELGLMIIDSSVHHELVDGEYKQRRDACEQASKELGVELLRDSSVQQVKSFKFSDSVIARRAEHVVCEIDRTFAMIECLKDGDFVEAGTLIQQSHESLRDLFEVSCPELDFIVSLCNSQPGVYGSRMMGGGFGGSAIVLVEKSKAEQVAETVEAAYHEQFGLKASIFLTNPAEGVRCERL